MAGVRLHEWCTPPTLPLSQGGWHSASVGGRAGFTGTLPYLPLSGLCHSRSHCCCRIFSGFSWVFLLHLLLFRDQLCSRSSAWYLQIKPIQDRLRGEEEEKLKYNSMPCLESSVLRWHLPALLPPFQGKNYSKMAQVFMECEEELEAQQKEFGSWGGGGGWALADLCCRDPKFRSSRGKHFEQGRPQLIFKGTEEWHTQVLLLHASSQVSPCEPNIRSNGCLTSEFSSWI